MVATYHHTPKYHHTSYTKLQHHPISLESHIQSIWNWPMVSSAQNFPTPKSLSLSPYPSSHTPHCSSWPSWMLHPASGLIEQVSRFTPAQYSSHALSPTATPFPGVMCPRVSMYIWKASIGLPCRLWHQFEFLRVWRLPHTVQVTFTVRSSVGRWAITTCHLLVRTHSVPMAIITPLGWPGPLASSQSISTSRHAI